MRVPGTHRARNDDSMMTPLIDVVFQLLIFFVCTASFEIAEESLPTSLLLAAGAGVDSPVEIEQPLERLVVKIEYRDERVVWTINERTYQSLVQVRDVLRQVAQIDASVPVVLDVGGAVPLGHVIDVYDLCRIAGFAKIQFAAKV